jgi:hypothetical protein
VSESSVLLVIEAAADRAEEEEALEGETSFEPLEGEERGRGNVRFVQRKPEPDQSVVESTLGRDSGAVLRDGVQAASPVPRGAE